MDKLKWRRLIDSPGNTEQPYRLLEELRQNGNDEFLNIMNLKALFQKGRFETKPVSVGNIFPSADCGSRKGVFVPGNHLANWQCGRRHFLRQLPAWHAISREREYSLKSLVFPCRNWSQFGNRDLKGKLGDCSSSWLWYHKLFNFFGLLSILCGLPWETCVVCYSDIEGKICRSKPATWSTPHSSFSQKSGGTCGCAVHIISISFFLWAFLSHKDIR